MLIFIAWIQRGLWDSVPDLKLSDEVNIHSLILENTWHFMEVPLKAVFVFSWRRPVEKKEVVLLFH